MGAVLQAGSMKRSISILAVAVGFAGCGEHSHEDGHDHDHHGHDHHDHATVPANVSLLEDCEPAYEPTFEAIVARTTSQSCVGDGNGCHASASGMGGLILDDPDSAFESLMSRSEGHALVAKGDPAHSELMVRLASRGEPYSMPPSAPISEGELCAIQKWIEAGASR